LIAERLFAPGGALEGVAQQVNEDAQWLEQIRARNHERAPLLPQAFLTSPAGEPWRHLWLGKVENNYASIVALRGIAPAVLPRVSEAARDLPGVQWVDKVSDISSVLGRYRQQMSKVLLLSYGAVWLLLFWRYRAVAWRILLPVATGSAATLAVLGMAGQSLQLFHVLAFMLLLGIGVDYGVFMQDRGAAQETSVGTAWMAVALSACSTLLSFGLLGLSHTPALQAFGTTMLLGATFVCLLVPCFQRRAARGALSSEMGRK
jgi:predicted exporter